MVLSRRMHSVAVGAGPPLQLNASCRGRRQAPRLDEATVQRDAGLMSPKRASAHRRSGHPSNRRFFVPWAKLNLSAKQHLDRFNRFCTAHTSVPNTQQRNTVELKRQFLEFMFPRGSAEILVSGITNHRSMGALSRQNLRQKS